MDHFEATTHPFIVRIWLEETAQEAGQATWRGQVIHVPSGERRTIHDLDEIRIFIAPYLEAMGVHLPRARPAWMRDLGQFVNRTLGLGHGRRQG